MALLEPKRLLLEDKELTGFMLAVTSDPRFTRAASAALLQMLADAKRETDPTSAASEFHRIEGAKSFLNLLLSVAEAPKPPAPLRMSDNLNHKA